MKKIILATLAMIMIACGTAKKADLLNVKEEVKRD